MVSGEWLVVTGSLAHREVIVRTSRPPGRTTGGDRAEQQAGGYKPHLAKRTNQAAWGLAIILAAGVLGGIGLMAVWLRW
jgi:hypothetical protein